MQSQDTERVCTEMLTMLDLEMSVGSTDKDVEKNQLWIVPFQVAASLFVLWLLKK